MTHQDNAQPISPDVVPDPANGPEPDQRVVHTPIPDSRAVALRNVCTWIADGWMMSKHWIWRWMGLITGYCVGWFFSAAFWEGWPFSSPSILSFGLALIICHSFFIAWCVHCYKKNRYGENLLLQKQGWFIRILIVTLIRLGSYIALLLIIISAFNLIKVDIGAGGIGTLHISAIFVVAITICDMAFWFAPVLILLHGISPIKAISMSWSASRKNIPGIILLCFASNILIGTIWFVPYQLIVMPVSMYSVLACLCIFFILCLYGFIIVFPYISYHDIFFSKEY
jgi:hypothetical protein